MRTIYLVLRSKQKGAEILNKFPLVIRPIAIAQHWTDYKITCVISLCMCLSVRALSVAILIQF